MATVLERAELAARQVDLGTRESVYQPEQPGLKFPAIPQFQSHAEERLYRKQHLVAAVRAFAQQGFDYGFAGHLTIRDPQHPELYWTNPMAVHFSQVKLSNLILADHAGKVVEGSYALNRAGFVLRGDDADPGVVEEGVVEGRDGAAGKPEDHLHARVHEHVDEDVGGAVGGG